MESIVLKFGGSSLCLSGFMTILDQIKRNDGRRVYIVVSAVQKTTSLLLKIAEMNDDTSNDIIKIHQDLCHMLDINDECINEIIKFLKNDIVNLISSPHIDQVQQKIRIITYGEVLSSIILHTFLKKHNVINGLISAPTFIQSNKLHTDIDPLNLGIIGEFNVNLKNLEYVTLDNLRVYVTQGFIASTKDNRLCILSRSGSDTSASILAAACESIRLEIWTDVDGMYTADPRIMPDSQIIRNLDYDICQELAASGCNILHPYCIKPCQLKHIPIHLRNTFNPNATERTIISYNYEISTNKVYAIANEDNVTVYNVYSTDMWGGFGFLANIAQVFSKYAIDINIVTTSQFSVSTTTNENNYSKLESARNSLTSLGYKVKMITDCSIVSIVADDVLKNYHLDKAHELVNSLGENHLHILHKSSNRLNLSLVVNSEITKSLMKLLHHQFIMKSISRVDNMDIWWRKIDPVKLMHCIKDLNSVYVYSLEDVDKKCKILKKILGNTVDSYYYAMKANNNIDVIKTIISNGFGIECVSSHEINFVKKHFNDALILFTPNYCHIDEFKEVFAQGDNVRVVIDNYQLLQDHPDIFSNKEIGIRLDLDEGDGHDKKVVTEGNNVKFGMPLSDIPQLMKLCTMINTKIVFLHSHKGSGILNPLAWTATYNKMHKLLDMFPDADTFDLGGGLGVKTNGIELDIEKMAQSLRDVAGKDIKLVIEPGRFLVAESGVILSTVTQVRSKGSFKYVGIDAGMNTLVRPIMYDAHHPIYNLTKINEDNIHQYEVVGPICETADIIGKKIMLPETIQGDTLLIEVTGAYGKVMASSYNMRDPPPEICI